jgi:ribosomal protein S18 acetylase RimI-like enzyme
VRYLRKMQLSDVNQIVQVHISTFQGFFLTFLGPKFLSLLYTYIISSPHGIGYVSLNDGDQIVGFVCGSIRPSGLYKDFFKKQWRRIVFAILSLVTRHLNVIPRLVWRILNPPQASTEEGTALLLSIAILPGYQNEGIGKNLVQNFLEEMERRNMRRVNLTTDKDSNDTVNSFYRRLGFQLVRSFVTPEGRWMNEYEISLSSRNTDA